MAGHPETFGPREREEGLSLKAAAPQQPDTKVRKTHTHISYIYIIYIFEKKPPSR